MVGWGAYARDKNTSARLCAKNAGGGAYLWDTTVHIYVYIYACRVHKYRLVIGSDSQHDIVVVEVYVLC